MYKEHTGNFALKQQKKALKFIYTFTYVFIAEV